MTKLRHGEIEISFNSEVVKAAAFEGELPGAPGTIASSPTKDELANLSPRGAVIESWLDIETALLEFSKRHGIQANQKKPFTLKDINWHRHEYHALGQGIIDMLNKLRRLRNEAVHLRDTDISSGAAKAYQALSQRAISCIEEA